MAQTEKIAISLSGELLSRVEQHRKTTKETRSALVQRALDQLLATETQQAKIERYLKGYQAYPEHEDVLLAAEKTSTYVLGEEPWE